MTLCIALSLGISSSVHALSLSEALDHALRHDASYAAKISESRMAAEQPIQAQAQLYPSIALSARQLNQSYQQPSIANPNQRNSVHESARSYYLQLSQPVYNPKLWRNLSLAEQKVIHAKLNEEQALQGLILRLVESYLSIILQHNYLTLSQETQKTSEERLEQVTAAMSVGYASQLDVYSLQAERDDMIARALFDEQQLQLAKKQLSQLTGLLITDRLPPIKVTPSALVNALGIDAESFRLLHEQNLEVKLKQLERDMAGAELASREAEHYPNVTLGSYYSQSEGTNYFAQKFDDQVVYLEVHVPLYQGGMTESRLREGKGQVQSLQQQLTAQTREAEKRIAQALSTIQTTSQRLDAIDKAVQSGKLYLESIEEGFRLGLRDMSEISLAKARLLNNQREQIKTQIDFVTAIVGLYYHSGQLTPAVIAQLSSTLARGKGVGEQR
jgi:outer membrane protein